MNVQARIPPALCAIHNFIYRYDPDDILESWDDSSDASSEDFESEQRHDASGTLAETIPDWRALRDATEWRDTIAEQMWNDYCQVMSTRAE